MRFLLIINILYFSLASLYGQEKEDSFVEYLLPVTFESIDTPGKLYFKFQDGNLKKTEKDSALLNMIRIDSSSYNYELSFANASIGIIEKCKYTLGIRKDTLNTVTVYVDNIQNLNQLIYQTKEQFGEPYINVENKEKLYEWRRAELNFLPILTVKKNQKEGELKISLK